MPSKLSRSKNRSGVLYAPGDVLSFRTSPATEFSPRETNRFAALKILNVTETLHYYVVLDGMFAQPPSLSEVFSLPWLRRSAFSNTGSPACLGVLIEWPCDLRDFTLIGNIPVTSEDQTLVSACRSFGPWSTASGWAESEWRWRNDQTTYREELERAKQAREARAAAERERYETRLKRLTWDQLLKEQPLARWETHPPFPPPDFTTAARNRIRAAVLELRALGPKPKRAQVRAILKTCVKWFNETNVAFGEVIETEEREDICATLEELAIVARQRPLIEEIEGWREW